MGSLREALDNLRVCLDELEVSLQGSEAAESAIDVFADERLGLPDLQVRVARLETLLGVQRPTMGALEQRIAALEAWMKGQVDLAADVDNLRRQVEILSRRIP